MSDWITRRRSASEIATIAVRARDIFGFFHSLVPNLVGILEHDLRNLVPDFEFFVENELRDETGNLLHGLTTFFPPEITLACDTYNALVRDDARARFTAAHELGHLFMHRTDKELHRAPSAVSNINNKANSSEWQANEFAAHFLVPDFIASAYDDPYELAQSTCVSVRVAQIRLNALGKWPRRRVLPPGFTL